MNRAFIVFFLCTFFFLLGNLEARACRETSVLEDISLPGQKSQEGFRTMMDIPEGLEAFCTLNNLDPRLFSEARDRLAFQDELIDVLYAEGELRSNQVRYYRAYFADLLENLNSCELKAMRMRQRGIVFQPAKLVDLNIRPSGLVDIFYKRTPTGFPYKHIVSHSIWFGRIIEEDGFPLCATNLLNQ